MRNITKLIALGLALVMLLALTPAVSVLADESTPERTVYYIGQDETGRYDSSRVYATISDAIAKADLSYATFLIIDDNLPSANINIAPTGGADILIDGGSSRCTFKGAFVVGHNNATTEGKEIKLTVKNIDFKGIEASAGGTHPAIYARRCSDITLEDCTATATAANDLVFSYAFAFGTYPGKLTINSGTYEADQYIVRTNYTNTETMYWTVNGGTFEVLGGAKTVGVINPVSGSKLNAVINDGKFIVHGEAKGETLFGTLGICNITINGGAFIADGALFAYLQGDTKSTFTITDGIFWQNVRFPIVFERQKAIDVSVTGGVFYSPDYRLYDGSEEGEPDDLYHASNKNTMSAIDALAAPTGSNFNCTVSNSKFYYVVSDNIPAYDKETGRKAIPASDTNGSVPILNHSTMCGKISGITPETVATDAAYAELYVVEGVTVPVVLDSTINNKAFENAVLYLTEDYDGAELEITQSITVETKGFDIGKLKAGKNACIRNGLDGTKMYVQYTTPNYFGQFSARIVFSVSSADYKSMGLYITSNKNGNVNHKDTAKLPSGVSQVIINKCYKSIIADGEVITAEQLGGQYIVAVEITDLDLSCLGKSIYFNVYGIGFDETITESGVKTLTLPAALS